MSAQQQFIGLAAKYVSLFSIAIVSSFLFLMVSVLVAYGIFGLELGTVDTVDMVINIMCLYLQYKFTAKEYHTYCVVADRCSRKWMTRSMKESVAKVKQQKWLSRSKSPSCEMADLGLPGSSTSPSSVETAPAVAKADKIKTRQIWIP